MSVKPPSLVYEPLKRSTAEAVVEDGDDCVFKSRSKFDAPALESKPEKISTPEPAQETWIHKHGHSVSYAGIFLFTALVFFRPYEWSPSLSWLSTSAFWVAVATLIAYVITQLGL